MQKAIIGKKICMTQIFNAEGKVVTQERFFLALFIMFDSVGISDNPSDEMVKAMEEE